MRLVIRTTKAKGPNLFESISSFEAKVPLIRGYILRMLGKDPYEKPYEAGTELWVFPNSGKILKIWRAPGGLFCSVTDRSGKTIHFSKTTERRVN